MQYKKGDYVKYASSGVCIIEDIRTMDSISKGREFYVLKPIKDTKSTVYVPLDNETLTEKMRYIMTKQEIDDLLKSIKFTDISWIDDRKIRSQTFKTILKTCRTVLAYKSCFMHLIKKMRNERQQQTSFCHR